MGRAASPASCATNPRISDMFGFSSPAYSSRYVQQYLGMKPSDYRE